MTEQAQDRPLATRRRIVLALRVVAGLGIVVVLVAVLLILLTPAEDRVETAWEEAPPGVGDPDTPGRVVIRAGFVRGRGGNGQVVVEPAPAGAPLRVVAVFDQRAYRLEHGFVDGDEPGWTFRVTFRRRRWFPLNPHQYPQEVRVQLPRGLPLRLEGSVAWGESDLQLGGLALLSVDWDTALGSHEISFAEPLAVPLERLSASGRVGSLQVRDLGRAGPALVELAHSVGDLAVDLEGAWARDATVQVGCNAAKCVVRAPDAAALVLSDGRVWTDGATGPAPRETPLPRLRFVPTRRLGGISIGSGAAVDVGTDDEP